MPFSPWTDQVPAPARRRLRVLAWRARRPAAALCAGLAVLVAVERLRPPDPPTVPTAVAARDLAAGTALTEADIVWRTVPADLVPDRVRASDDGGSTDRVTPGRRLAVPVPAGLPLVAELLVDDASTPPDGTVVVPVRFADTGVAAVLRPGMRVDVVAAGLHDEAAPERLARDALVLAGGPGGGGTPGGTPDRPGGGLLGGSQGASGTDEDVPVLLAVSPEESVVLGGASASRALGAVIVG